MAMLSDLIKQKADYLDIKIQRAIPLPLTDIELEWEKHKRKVDALPDDILGFIKERIAKQPETVTKKEFTRSLKKGGNITYSSLVIDLPELSGKNKWGEPAYPTIIKVVENTQELRKITCYARNPFINLVYMWEIYKNQNPAPEFL